MTGCSEVLLCSEFTEISDCFVLSALPISIVSMNSRSSLVFTKELASESPSGISSSLSTSCNSASVFNSVISVSFSLAESSKVGRRNWEGKDISSGITYHLIPLN